MKKQKFKIGKAKEVDGGTTLIFGHDEVPEDIFWELMENELKVITHKHPEKYTELLEESKKCVNEGNQLTIGDRCFSIV